MVRKMDPDTPDFGDITHHPIFHMCGNKNLPCAPSVTISPKHSDQARHLTMFLESYWRCISANFRDTPLVKPNIKISWLSGKVIRCKISRCRSACGYPPKCTNFISSCALIRLAAINRCLGSVKSVNTARYSVRAVSINSTKMINQCCFIFCENVDRWHPCLSPNYLNKYQKQPRPSKLNQQSTKNVRIGERSESTNSRNDTAKDTQKRINPPTKETVNGGSLSV